MQLCFCQSEELITTGYGVNEKSPSPLVFVKRFGDVCYEKKQGDEPIRKLFMYFIVVSGRHVTQCGFYTFESWYLSVLKHFHSTTAKQHWSKCKIKHFTIHGTDRAKPHHF